VVQRYVQQRGQPPCIKITQNTLPSAHLPTSGIPTSGNAENRIDSPSLRACNGIMMMISLALVDQEGCKIAMYASQRVIIVVQFKVIQ